MAAIPAMQEGAVALLGMGHTTKVVVTIALQRLLNTLARSNSMEDSRNLPMAQGTSLIKDNSNRPITRTSIATMAPPKASRRDITKAVMLRTPIPTIRLVVVEAQTTTMKVNSVSSLLRVGMRGLWKTLIGVV